VILVDGRTVSDPIDISDLHPDLGSKIRQMEIRLTGEGIEIVKTSGARGFLAQAKLYIAYKHGLSKYPAAAAGTSRHHPFFDGKSGACDLSPVHVTEEVREHQKIRMGALAKEIGLVWGGDFAVADNVHFELPGLDVWQHYMNLMGTLDRQRGF
jgi:hypothetical protein